ncbi:MAG TPA: carboxypeptidase regulatory-like domain-containing protein [Armatimonadota bacterium]|nr:carboxypeptidase regulatory-like domain-containing protein [Armatimonadota bacterium]
MRFPKLPILMLLLLTLAAPAWCGKIVGSVRDSGTRKTLAEIVVRAYAAGRSLAQTASTDNDGVFAMSDLPPGRYAVCVGVRNDSRPQVAWVAVPEDGEAEVHFGLARSIEVEGDSWLQERPVFYQSFTASGLGVTSLKLKAFGPWRTVKAQMLDGDGISGTPIGPSRTTVRFGDEREAAVFWSGGELPTVPGKAYTFKMSAERGEPWIPGVAGRGDVYPLGKAYFGSEPRPLSDLGFTICEEKDNLGTSYAVSPGRRARLVRAVGQTFVARGKNILFASAFVSRATPYAAYVRFSIHENGPGGRQIGPSKGTSIGADTAVAWLPEEVNVTPGKTYYLHIESYEGGRFHAYEEPDAYAKGGAYNDAVLDRKYDLAAWISGELSESEQTRLFRHPKSVTAVPLANPSFENGLKGWTLTRDCGRAVECDGGIIPAWGAKMFGWTNKGAGEGWRTVVYQTAKVAKGRRYCFSGSVYTDHVGGRSCDQRVRLVANPAGKPDFAGGSITSSQWYATEGEWRRGSVEFTAQADVITVGFELDQLQNRDVCNLYADGAHLEQIAEE